MMVVQQKIEVNGGKEWACENPPRNPQLYCIKVSPLKPSAKPEHLEYMHKVLKFPFTIELKVWADGYHRYALFDFETKEDAAKAFMGIEFHLQHNRDKSLVFKYNSQAYSPNPRIIPPITNRRSRAVYVGNLRPKTNYENLLEFGAITFARFELTGFRGVPMAHYWYSDKNPRTTSICYGIFLFETPDEAQDALDCLLSLKETNQLDWKIFMRSSRIEFARKYREYSYQPEAH